MIGKGKGTGRVTWLGPAKPDDPIFKEGWSIHVGGLLGQTEPLNSKPDEADESENVMRDPMTGEAIRCRYCNSAEDCPHLLALINWDWPRSPSGRCADRFGEFRELVETAFLPRLQSGTGGKWVWSVRESNELWDYARLSFSDGDKIVRLDGVIVAQLVIDMFDGSGGEKYSRSVENAPGPGLATVWTLYYAKNPAAVLDAADVESAHIYGVSMGGMIAQEFALQYPKRVKSLILGCTQAGGPEAKRAEPEVLAVLTRQGMTPEEAARAINPYIYHTTTPPSRWPSPPPARWSTRSVQARRRCRC